MKRSKPPGPAHPPQGDNARAWGGTWPLFNDPAGAPFPDNPKHAVTPFRPQNSDLETLEGRDDYPESTQQAEQDAQRLRQSAPPPAPEWLRAAQAMVDWLQQRILRGDLGPIEEATISRTWAAFSLAGVSEPQTLRVAHLVSRAHHAIRETPRGAVELQAALLDCAGVLHRNLPSAIRERMSLERTTQVVRKLKGEADHWAAVVEGTSELLGWKDYARMHAAVILRALIERGPLK